MAVRLPTGESVYRLLGTPAYGGKTAKIEGEPGNYTLEIDGIKLAAVEELEGLGQVNFRSDEFEQDGMKKRLRAKVDTDGKLFLYVDTGDPAVDAVFIGMRGGLR